MGAGVLMAERPILFSAPMVRAILDGSKTVTRRVLNPQPPAWATVMGWSAFTPPGKMSARGTDPKHGPSEAFVRLPWQKGDTLWVRETWTSGFGREGSGSYTIFAADGVAELNERSHAKGPHYNVNDRPPVMVWRPSIFMPRWACRITVEVTDVRCERLQDISEQDAKAEGAQAANGHPELGAIIGAGPSHREGFAQLWRAINGKRPGCSWGDNPWVWCVSFKRINSR